MAVIPICARLNDREFINEFGSRLDAGKTDAGYAVHLKGQDQTVPVDRAVFVKIVDDGEACGLSLLQPDKRSRHRAVDPDGTTEPAVDPHCLPRNAQGDVVAGYGGKGRGAPRRDRPCPGRKPRRRTEEHTSELQSLMRISYA